MNTGSTNSTTTTTTIKWSELPKELLENIGNHLDSRIDVFRFRAVSTSWRSILSLSYLHSPPIPLNLPPPINTTTVFFSRFTICRLEHHSRSSSCLVKVVDSTPRKPNLLHPFSNTTKISHQFRESSDKSRSHTHFMRSINLLDFRLIELTKGFSFSLECKLIKKVVLFRNNGILVLFESGRLWYGKFRDDDDDEQDWVHLGSETNRYDDIMLYKDQYYVIDNLGIMFWIDDRSMNFVQYAPPLCGLGQVKHLVVSDGHFYVVDCFLEEDVAAGGFQHRARRVGMKVYRLDEEWGTWVDVKSLEDRVFVLGKEVCYSVSVKDFPGCPGDCIYFVDHRLEDRNVEAAEVKRLVIRVFRLDNGTIRTMDCFPAYRRLFSPPLNCSLPTLSTP